MSEITIASLPVTPLPIPNYISPTPTLPPDHLSLESGMKGKKKSLRIYGCLEISLGEGDVQLPPQVPLPWLTIGHLANGDGRSSVLTQRC